jgi:anti-sigma regulatory factor (Ser/Thr protein kinase)
VSRRQRSFAARTDVLASVRAFLRDCAGGALLESDLDDILLAVCEAAANAIRHSGSGRFRVRWRRSGQSVTVEVEDEGVFVERAEWHDVHGTGHRGQQIIAALMDGVALRKGTRDRPGTRVRMVKHVAAVGSIASATKAAAP